MCAILSRRLVVGIVGSIFFPDNNFLLVAAVFVWSSLIPIVVVMASIAKLAIRGIRSFSPDDDEQVGNATERMHFSSLWYQFLW